MRYTSEERAARWQALAPGLYSQLLAIRQEIADLHRQTEALRKRAGDVEGEIVKIVRAAEWDERRAALLADGWREVPGTGQIVKLDELGHTVTVETPTSTWPLVVKLTTGRRLRASRHVPPLIEPAVLYEVLGLTPPKPKRTRGEEVRP